MINVNGLKRNAKNIVKKYSDAQIKVREATSNDPWGPSSTTMAEIADLTYNVVAFSEIMQMIWKRLNDHGKNWRHVYKALVVLEYLIKTGSDKVAQQCIENIFAIQTLKDFQYMEENKDHGMNIREKSKKLVALLKDPEKLQAERARAIKAKSRLAESMSSVGKNSMGSTLSSSGASSGSGDTAANNYLNYHGDSGGAGGTMAFLGAGAGAGAGAGVGGSSEANSLGVSSSGLDSARPQTASEEENQLKLALALSKEEAEQQEKTRKNDELRLKIALDVSKKSAGGSTSLLDDVTATSSSQQSTAATASSSSLPTVGSAPAPGPSKGSNIDDLLGLTIQPSNLPEPQNDPWSSDPWQTPLNQQPVPPSFAPTSLQTVLPPPLSQPTATTLAPLSVTATTVPAPSLLSNTNCTLNLRPTTMSKNPFAD